jgi:hypothetical protein
MSNGRDTFVDRALSGEASLDDIDDYVDTWHDDAAEKRELHDYLGLTRDEYGLWVEQPSSLRFILFSRRHDEDLPEVLDRFAADEALAGEPVAARAASREEAQAVRSWLVETGRLES